MLQLLTSAALCTVAYPSAADASTRPQAPRAGVYRRHCAGYVRLLLCGVSLASTAVYLSVIAVGRQSPSRYATLSGFVLI